MLASHPSPSGSPATRRPPLMQSSTAYSSAMRIGGDVAEIVAPSWTRATLSSPWSRVVLASAAADTFGLHMNPYGFLWGSLGPTPSKPSFAASMSSSSDQL